MANLNLDNNTIMWILVIVIIIGLIMVYFDLEKCSNASYGGLMVSAAGVLGSCIFAYMTSK
jgi:hypothetical protein